MRVRQGPGGATGARADRCARSGLHLPRVRRGVSSRTTRSGIIIGCAGRFLFRCERPHGLHRRVSFAARPLLRQRLPALSLRGGQMRWRGKWFRGIGKWLVAPVPAHPSPSIPLPVKRRGRPATFRPDSSGHWSNRWSCKSAPGEYRYASVIPSPLNGERARVRGENAVQISQPFWLSFALAACFPIMLSATTFTEDFSTDPAANGWQIFGNTNLFQWDSTNQNLRVTWDSSLTNSYFHRPLGTILTRDDDFSLNFDLTFADYASGTTPGKPYAAPVAIGFLNLDQAAHTNFSRAPASMPLTVRGIWSNSISFPRSMSFCPRLTRSSFPRTTSGSTTTTT